jgi:Spy/CpxP family protein refolding chaperone
MNRVKTTLAAAALLLSLGLPARADNPDKAKLKEAFKAGREAIKPLRRELRDAMTELRDKVEDKASDKELEASLAKVEKAREALRAEKMRFRKAMAAKMTPEQRAKMALRLSKRHRAKAEGRWRQRASRRVDVESL